MDYKLKVRCTNPLKNLKKYHGCLLQKVLLISNKAILRDLFEKEYHSSVNFGADPESGLEIKKFLMDMPFRGEGGSDFWSSHTHTHTHTHIQNR